MCQRLFVGYRLELVASVVSGLFAQACTLYCVLCVCACMHECLRVCVCVCVCLRVCKSVIRLTSYGHTQPSSHVIICSTIIDDIHILRRTTTSA